MVLLPEFSSDAFQALEHYEIGRSSTLACHSESL